MPELLPKQEFDKLTRAINRLHRETIVSPRRFRLWTQDDAQTQNFSSARAFHHQRSAPENPN